MKPRDIALAQKIIGGMSINQAKHEVGIRMTGSPALTQNQSNIVEMMREEIQREPGHTFADAAEFYQQASVGKKKRKMTQLYARSRHDKIMGYDAPQKVEVHERKEINQAVMVLHLLADKTGLSPAELFKQIKEEPQNGREIEDRAAPQGDKVTQESRTVCDPGVT